MTRELKNIFRCFWTPKSGERWIDIQDVVFNNLGEERKRGELHSDGYFDGYHGKDIGIIRHMMKIIADDGKYVPVLLEEIARSKRVALLRKSGEANLSEQTLREKIKTGEIPDIYNMAEIESELFKIFGESITLHPPTSSEHQIKGWEEFSPRLQKVVEKYFVFSD
jgi:hypothetical protein